MGIVLHLCVPHTLPYLWVLVLFEKVPAGVSGVGKMCSSACHLARYDVFRVSVSWIDKRKCYQSRAIKHQSTDEGLVLVVHLLRFKSTCTTTSAPGHAAHWVSPAWISYSPMLHLLVQTSALYVLAWEVSCSAVEQ